MATRANLGALKSESNQSRFADFEDGFGLWHLCRTGATAEQEAVRIARAAGYLVEILQRLQDPPEQEHLFGFNVTSLELWERILADSFRVSLIGAIPAIELGSRHYQSSVHAVADLSGSLLDVAFGADRPPFRKLDFAGALTRRFGAAFERVRNVFVDGLRDVNLEKLEAHVAADQRSILDRATSGRALITLKPESACRTKPEASLESVIRLEQASVPTFESIKDRLRDRLEGCGLRSEKAVKLAWELAQAKEPRSLRSLFDNPGELSGAHKAAAFGKKGSAKNVKGGLVGERLADIERVGRGVLLLSTSRLCELIASLVAR